MWFSAFSTNLDTLLPMVSDHLIGGFNSYDAESESIGLRPVVSIPTSKIRINGDTVIVLP